MDWLEIKEFFKDTFKYAIFIIVVFIVVIYVISLQQVVGNSMKPTLGTNDIVFLDKISYNFVDIKRGDIVSFLYDDTKYLIKRVIGLPGEKVEFKDNTLYVNDKELKEPYLNDVITDDFSLSNLGYDEIPNNMYLVLGDNRQDSLDSRDKRVGLVKKEDIIGKIGIRVWPLNKIGLVK